MEPDSLYLHSGLRNKSLINPKHGNHQCLDVFRLMMEQEIENITTQPGKKDYRIQHGIEELEKNKNIVIRSADKGEP